MEPVCLKYQARPAEPCPSDDRPKLDLKVVFTDLRKTAAALATAHGMARGLGARITLIVAQVVPYPLPLAAPPVPVEFTERLLEPMAAARDDVDTIVEICLCRDRCETLRRALPPNSVVILGTRKLRWWPCWERKLASMLRKDGRRVLLVTV